MALSSSMEDEASRETAFVRGRPVARVSTVVKVRQAIRGSDSNGRLETVERVIGGVPINCDVTSFLESRRRYSMQGRETEPLSSTRILTAMMKTIETR